MAEAMTVDLAVTVALAFAIAVAFALAVAVVSASYYGCDCGVGYCSVCGS